MAHLGHDLGLLLWASCAVLAAACAKTPTAPAPAAADARPAAAATPDAQPLTGVEKHLAIAAVQTGGRMFTRPS